VLSHPRRPVAALRLVPDLRSFSGLRRPRVHTRQPGTHRRRPALTQHRYKSGGSTHDAITDYDAPRRPSVELEDDSLEELKARRATTQSPTADLDESDAEDFELPGADLAEEELTVSAIPIGADEFRCDPCLLVHHRSQLVVQPPVSGCAGTAPEPRANGSTPGSGPDESEAVVRRAADGDRRPALPLPVFPRQPEPTLSTMISPTWPRA
jgi:Domain of unknown function (DUF4193)